MLLLYAHLYIVYSSSFSSQIYIYSELAHHNVKILLTPTSIIVGDFDHFSIMIKCMSSESLQRSSGYFIALLKGCPRLRIPLKDPPNTWLP